MPNKRPQVSVVMPVYNVERYVAEAIESILEQTFKDFELIIVDDGSKDRTWEIIDSYAKRDRRVLVIKNKKNLKMSRSLNKGISIARGKYIARMDADDISYPDRLERQVRYMEDHPEVGISGGSMRIMDDNGKVYSRRDYVLEDTLLRKKVFMYSPFCHPSVIMRKSVLERVKEKCGYYNHAFNPAEDIDLYFRIGKHSKFGNLPDVLLKYRVVKSSMVHGGLRRNELNAIKARTKHFKDQSYNVRLVDRLYNILHFVSAYTLPYRFKLFLFNFFRNTRKDRKKLETENVVVVSHKYLTQPDDDLIMYLNSKKCSNVLHIKHSFYEAKDRRSFCSWYKEGKIYKEQKTMDYKKLPEPLLYIKEAFFTVWWVINGGVRWDLYVGMDGLLTLFGNFLRIFQTVKRTVFWAIDFVPEGRFKAKWKNKIYEKINLNGYKSADEMWDISPRMIEARERFLGIKKSDYRVHRMVPYGVWLDKIKHYDYEECEKNTIVFMGVLIPKQGVQLVLQAMPRLLERVPDLTFKIIGGGEYGDKLKEMAKNLGVESYCLFLGRIGLDEYESALIPEIAKSAVALAPYVKKLDTWTHYADPGKVKTYLSCGVPVVLSNVPWSAKEIEKKRCGVIVSEDPEDIAEKILVLLDPEVNQEYRRNAIEYAKGFDNTKIFKEVGL